MSHPGGRAVDSLAVAGPPRPRPPTDPHQSNTVSDPKGRVGVPTLTRVPYSILIDFFQMWSFLLTIYQYEWNYLFRCFKESGTVCHLVYHCLSMFRPSQPSGLSGISSPCLGLCGTKSGLSKTKVVIASQSQRKKQQFRLQPKKIQSFFMKWIQSNELDLWFTKSIKKNEDVFLIKDIELSLARLKVPVALLFRHHS